MKIVRWILCLAMIAMSITSFAEVSKPSSMKQAKDACVLEDLATSGLGDVKYSILSEAQFQAVNGPEWVLMKGQSKTAIDAITPAGDNNVFNYFDEENSAFDNLPDAGGLFLRAKDHENSSNNPDKMLLGEFQEDMLKSHSHSLGANNGWYGMSRMGASNVSSIYGYFETTATGGPETRPKNITVNVFVKVRRKCLDDVATTARNQNATRITGLEEFNSINVCDTCLTMSEGDLTQLRAKLTCFQGEVDAFEADQRKWSVTCQARTIGNSKKVLMQIGVANRTSEENEFLSHLDNQYPYYNVVMAQ